MKQSISEEILKKYGLKGVHPIADLFPLLAGDDREEFRKSVNARGVLVPIAVNPQGILLEGRNRLIIADELGVKCPKVVVDAPRDDEAGWIIAMNLKRRHLDTGQRANIAAKLATMPYGTNQYSGGANLPLHQTSVEQAAKQMQVSPRSVKMARKVRKEAAPEVVEKVERGEMTLNAAHETLKQPEQVGGKETELPSAVPSAEIDDQCRERIKPIVKLIQALFSSLDAPRLKFTAKELQNEIERIFLKTQKKKQRRASELAQQKLASDGEAGWGPSSRDTIGTTALARKKKSGAVPERFHRR